MAAARASLSTKEKRPWRVLTPVKAIRGKSAAVAQ
jgi:hypothetical protein